MFFKFTLLVFGMLFTTSCSNQFDYISETNKTVKKSIKQLCYQENLISMGGGGAMMDEVTEISVMFGHYNKVSIEEARRICVTCVETIKDAVNANEKLQPYLSPYPFPHQGMDIAVLFLGKDHSFIGHGCVYLGTGGVSSVHLGKDYLNFASYNPRSKMLEDYYHEPYVESLKIVQMQCEEQPQSVQ